MNPLFQHFIIQRVLKSNQHGGRKSTMSDEQRFKRTRKIIIHITKDLFLICIGILSAGFGLKGFLLPNSFIDGGVTGISLLANQFSGINVGLLIATINIPFIILGFTQVGRNFAIKSILSIVGLAIGLQFIEYPVITTDKLLVAVFGGFFLGAGIGLTIRGGAVLDGTEVLAIFLSKKTGLTIGDIILIFNIIIFSVAAYLLSVITALYSVLIYLAASKTVDFFITGIEEYIGVTIVSKHSEEIRLVIIENLGRGVTVYSGKRGYGKRGENLNETEIIYSVVTRLEVGKLEAEIEKIDPEAFVVMNSIKDTKGGMIKKRPLR
jgi:uncharacterized membrane-anchored protein YitT (DUF2179 family)